MDPFENIRGLKLDGHLYSRTDLAERDFGPYLENPFQKDILAFASKLVTDTPDVTVWTSGSTGAPKGLTFPKSAVWRSAEATNAFFGLNAESRALLSLPMEYIAGKMMVARALAGGYELISVAPCTNPLTEISREMVIDFAPFTPHQATVMARENPERLASIGKILLGGSAVGDELRQRLCGIGCEAYIGFGMAETLSHFALARISESGGPIYHPLKGVRIETDDKNRLVVHRPGILDGALTTNDIIEKVQGGFRWLGRADNAIITGGVNVFPEQIEQKLAPQIRGGFFVSGLPHETLGREVVLFVEGVEGVDTIDIDYASAGLGKFEIPRRVVFIERFLYTESGKIRRKATVGNRGG